MVAASPPWLHPSSRERFLHEPAQGPTSLSIDVSSARLRPLKVVLRRPAQTYHFGISSSPLLPWMAHSEAMCRACLINYPTVDSQFPCCAQGTVFRTDAFEVAGKKPHQRAVSLPRHLKTLAEIGVLYGNDRQRRHWSFVDEMILTENLINTRGRTSKEPHSSWLVLRTTTDQSLGFVIGVEHFQLAPMVPTTSSRSATPEI
ncbi:hypothetical protein NA56DRAFT_640662 [Hyaloscypha hepaticicola]|uniref:Uncharacterized protein n=1 Tax=Hyaloscypha hepaticicola TaxID=2082293 RepID=A0A2J6QNS8_9HELO|nr:hypothetical protein NA56DRAFT_640662 [Hyaloscypha hepaticicola]